MKKMNLKWFKTAFFWPSQRYKPQLFPTVSIPVENTGESLCPHFRRYDAEFTTSRATKRSAQPQIQAYKKENQPRFSLYKKELFSYPTPRNPLEPPWSLFMLGWLQKPWLFVVNRNHHPLNGISFLQLCTTPNYSALEKGTKIIEAHLETPQTLARQKLSREGKIEIQ